MAEVAPPAPPAGVLGRRPTRDASITPESPPEPPKKKRPPEGAGAPKGRAPEGAGTPKRKLEGNDLSMYAKVRLRALGAAYGEVAAIEGERYVVKTGAGYDSVAADELSADAKRAKTGGA